MPSRFNLHNGDHDAEILSNSSRDAEEAAFLVTNSELKYEHGAMYVEGPRLKSQDSSVCVSRPPDNTPQGVYIYILTFIEPNLSSAGAGARLLAPGRGQA
jgi:hypothetical protein